MIQGHLDHGASKEPTIPCPCRVDSSVPLMHHDPSDLGSLILIWIIPKKRTLKKTCTSAFYFRDNALCFFNLPDVCNSWPERQLINRFSSLLIDWFRLVWANRVIYSCSFRLLSIAETSACAVPPVNWEEIMVNLFQNIIVSCSVPRELIKLSWRSK